MEQRVRMVIGSDVGQTVKEAFSQVKPWRRGCSYYYSWFTFGGPWFRFLVIHSMETSGRKSLKDGHSRFPLYSFQIIVNN
jgi:hypothetical protein